MDVFFSKKAWSLPLKSKSGRDVTRAFEQILDDQPCNMVQSDKGTEFINSTFQSMLSRPGIKFYTSENEDIKAAVVERFYRTLKEKCIAILPQKTLADTSIFYRISYAYNHCSHRSIGTDPASVTADNEDKI